MLLGTDRELETGAASPQSVVRGRPFPHRVQPLLRQEPGDSCPPVVRLLRRSTGVSASVVLVCGPTGNVWATSEGTATVGGAFAATSPTEGELLRPSRRAAPFVHRPGGEVGTDPATGQRDPLLRVPRCPLSDSRPRRRARRPRRTFAAMRHSRPPMRSGTPAGRAGLGTPLRYGIGVWAWAGGGGGGPEPPTRRGPRTTNQQYGIWGGLDEEERRQVRRLWRRHRVADRHGASRAVAGSAGNFPQR